MTDNNTRRPGPWDPKPEPAGAAPGATTTARTPAGVAGPPAVQGQSLVWALISTALLAGLLWYFTRSWVVAVAAIWGLLVHEYGHVLAMNRYGMGPAKIYIIPFLGGMARGQRMPESEWEGVKVSLAGPLFGLLAAIPFFILFLVLGGKVWLLGAVVIAAINLINLAPAPPLDGSRALGPVLARIHPMVEKGAMIAMGALVVLWGISNGSYIFAAFLALALFGHLRRGAWRPEGRPLSGAEAGYSVGLFVLAAVACAGVTMAALIPLTDGTVTGALTIAGNYLGFGR
ncbi:site-2 protease family protein [uncultured Brevundimonas sp.]|uniref:metalloprotease n=1 Tax=uncultured Brevundimonas sp. TaxID=213418 RepID=UPI0030EB9E31|tara:strand:- start:47497 stop:48357 length:861 start_codon:yes stop_codon:yes gene_type:complete